MNLVLRMLFGLLLATAAPTAFQLKANAPSGSEVGEQVGVELRAADEEVAAEAGQSNGKSNFQSSYAEALGSQEIVLVNPQVSKVLRQTNGLASALIAKDSFCERRWDAICPDGWTSADGDQCVAPASYGGACKKVQSFVGKTVIQKQQIAEQCRAPWPCNDDCTEGRDYSELCPEGWRNDGGGFCEAPADTATDCATSYNFANMDTKAKSELAQTCGFNWKCKATCLQDFGKSCPEDWSEVPLNPGFCTAPATYAGLCSYSINTATMTPEQKEAFSRKCVARFPCIGPDAIAQAAQKETHRDGVMPDGAIGADGKVISVLRTLNPAAPSAGQPLARADRIAKFFRGSRTPL